MAKTMPPSVVSFSLCCLMIVTACLCFAVKNVYSKTLESDTEVLRCLHLAVDPVSVTPSSYLSTWDFQTDPCESSGGQFLGILCTIPIDNSSSRVTSISLDRAGYDGFLSPEVGNLTELIALDVSYNKFRGPIPDTFSRLLKLTMLSLAQNAFTGTIPTGISKLRMLENIDLSHNRISGSVPAFIAGFRSLVDLRLSNNGFSGAIPNLTGLWQLNTLDFSSNQLYGSLPEFPKLLRRLYLNHNVLSGHISSLSNLGQVQTLDLSDNRFSGSISNEILGLPELVHLNISMNRFTTLNVASFTGKQTQLHVLDAQRNSLHGHLPPNLVTAANLTSINLAFNQFSGPIPKDYGAKIGESWRSLFLDHNFLTGNLPSEFSGHSKLRFRGSLANNCLRCPLDVGLCHGGQRPPTECAKA